MPPGAWWDFIVEGGRTVRGSAQMPTHAAKLHEWGTRGMGGFSCIGHPPCIGFFCTAAHPENVL
jgi:hypothetical protein